MQEKTHSYNILIPYEIIMDKRLTDFEKLLYGEIRILAKKNGYCFATNDYLAKRYNKDERTIRRALKKLNDYLYIITIFDSNSRKIYLFEDYV